MVLQHAELQKLQLLHEALLLLVLGLLDAGLLHLPIPQNKHFLIIIIINLLINISLVFND